MNPANKSIYRFDDITLDGENFRVQKDSQKVTLTPRAFDVLLFIIKNDGRVVEKQEVFEQIWKDNFVSDNALSKIIKEIRHALADSADAPRYIETVQKRGYRFIGKLKEKPGFPSLIIDSNNLEQTANDKTNRAGKKAGYSIFPIKLKPFAFSKPASALLIVGLILISVLVIWFSLRNRAAEAAPLPIRSIAVLPFKPLDAGSRDESLEMGMAETLITRLSNLNQIIVRPMSAVRKYNELQQDPVQAGQEVQVEAVLDGSIQKSGERIRVTVRLINVHNGLPLWSEQFDEKFTDIFNVQDAIAERVTNYLTLQLSKQEKDRLTRHYTNNPEAYQLYLRGQLLWHGRRPHWIEQSLAYYRQSLEKDPNFALAHIGVADCYMMLSGHDHMTMPEAETKAGPEIMKALEIDETLAQAHNALAELKYQYGYDWPGAEQEFKKAIELNPNASWIRQAYGWFLMSAGRFDEAIVEMEKARELDPSSLTVNVALGRLYYFSRQYDQAIRQFQNIIAVEPNDDSLYLAIYPAYEQKQMYAEAVEAFLKFHSLHGMPPETVEEFREAFRVSGWQGFLRKQIEGRENNNKGNLENPANMAAIYARLGQNDKAFAYFEKTFEQRRPTILQFKIEPAYDSLRHDPRYAELLQKIGLKP